jgi:kynurenine formamidase
VSRLVDLSHPIEAGMVTYPGLPVPVISDFLSREASAAKYGGQAEFHIARVEMVANTGTYIDAPSHRHAGGMDIAALPLQSVAALPGIVIPLTSGRAAGEDLFREADVRGRAVLIATGWSSRWRTDGYGAPEHPFLARSGAEMLASRGAALVGIDSVNIDDMADLERPAHTVLLRHGIPVVEHLTSLGALGDAPFRFFAVPAPFRGVGTFPVRAFAVVDSDE